jgi:redox-sensitive bicupin YhaK (pirin superfamily)
MSTSLILRPGVSLRRGADRHQTRIGWLHGRHSFDTGIDPLGAAALHVARLEPSQSVTVPDAPFVHVYVTRGRMDLEAEGALDAGDAARLAAAGERRLAAAEPSEVLIWEMHAGLGPASG